MADVEEGEADEASEGEGGPSCLQDVTDADNSREQRDVRQQENRMNGKHAAMIPRRGVRRQ